MSNEYTARYRLTEEDVVAGGLLATARQQFLRPILPIMLGAAIVLYAILFFLDRDAALHPMLLALMAAVPLAMLLLVKVLLPWQLRRHFRQTAGLKDEVEMSWDADGLRFSAPRGQSRLAWSDYYSWTENDRLLLLYQSEMLFNAVPKAVLSDDQLADFRANLERANIRKV